MFRYVALPFSVASDGDMLLKMLHETFKGLPSVFRTADNIFILWYDSNGTDNGKGAEDMQKRKP